MHELYFFAAGDPHNINVYQHNGVTVRDVPRSWRCRWRGQQGRQSLPKGLRESQRCQQKNKLPSSYLQEQKFLT